MIDHLVEIARVGRVMCQHSGCRDRASRYVRCAKCRTVIAKCFDHGGDIERQRDAHCAR